MNLKTYIFSLIFLLITSALSANSIGLLSLNSPEVSVENEYYGLQNGDERVLLYPNPAHSTTQIKISDTKVTVSHVVVYSILGNPVLKKAATAGQKDLSLNIQNLKKGKYFVKVFFEDGSQEVEVLIKQ